MYTYITFILLECLANWGKGGAYVDISLGTQGNFFVKVKLLDHA